MESYKYSLFSYTSCGWFFEDVSRLEPVKNMQYAEQSFHYARMLVKNKNAKFVEEAKAQGRKVLMVGDGINDSPALSAADVGIAISDGAELAREIADITIGADDLSVMVTLKEISNGLMDKIHKNYRRIVGINGSLIALGVTGVIQPTMSALLHNTSTLLIGMDSMKSVL